MSILEVQAANITPPYSVAGNDFDQKRYTAGTTHLASPIPESWHGAFVTLRVRGGDLAYSFSEDENAEVQIDVTPTDDGASAKVGKPLLDGEQDTFRIKLPSVPGAIVYFVREASADGCACDIGRSSETVQLD